MKIGAFTTFTPEYNFPEACKLLKTLGYQGVQPKIVTEKDAKFDPTLPYNPWNNNRGGILEQDFIQDPKGVLAPAKAAGLEITSIASYAGVGEMARAVALVKACGQAGIRHCRIGGLWIPADKKYDWRELMDRSRGLYREMVVEAKKAGVRPCIEIHMGGLYPNAAGAMHLLQGLSPDEVGVLYDPGNMMYEGWEPPSLALHILGPYLAEVHVKNATWVPSADGPHGIKTWKPVAADLEAGYVNWAEVIGELKAAGFTGWLVEEGHTGSGGRDTYTRLKMAYELLSKLAG